MDLNLPPPDMNPESNVLPHSKVGSVHPPTNPKIVGEQPREDQRIPKRMPDWLAQLTIKNNPYRAQEQF